MDQHERINYAVHSNHGADTMLEEEPVTLSTGRKQKIRKLEGAAEKFFFEMVDQCAYGVVVKWSGGRA